MRRITRAEYKKLADKAAPPSPLGRNLLMAFVVGGLICCLGETIKRGFLAAGLAEEIAAGATSASLIFLSALTTGLGWYDSLARHAGAGTLVPITGFANAVASPALEFKTEGFVAGMAAKMFTIAGPVIVYGVLASAVYGVIYWLTLLF